MKLTSLVLSLLINNDNDDYDIIWEAACPTEEYAAVYKKKNYVNV